MASSSSSMPPESTKPADQGANSQRDLGKEASDYDVEEMISSLPKDKGWLTHHFHFYQGFWNDRRALKRIVFAQHNFKAQSSDILFATSPKCGTTWLKSLAFAVKNRAAGAKDQDLLTTANPHELVPFLEYGLFQTYSLSGVEALPPPRFIATHIPFGALPESVSSSGCRIVYLCRDPKDTFVSMWHFYGKLHMTKLYTEVPFPISLQEAYELFCQGVSMFGPYWDHVLGYYKASLEWPERVMFLKYEDMKSDTLDHVKRLADFLGYPFSLEEEAKGVAEEIIQLCSFENMSNLEVTKNGKYYGILKNDAFYRKGEVGDSKNHLTVEMMIRIDEITMEKFRGFEIGY